MMIISNINDPVKIKKFMVIDEVWENISDDMASKESYEILMTTKSLWLKIEINNNLAGMVLLQNENLSTLKLHPCLLKKYKKHSRELIKKILSLFLRTPYFVNKIIVEIPSNRRIVYNLAKKIGFIDEGINKKSFLKDGIFLDQWRLGLTKEEVEKIL